MIEKSRRVTRKIFNEVLKTGKIYNQPFSSLYIILSQNKSRIACVVPKKIERSAAVRNKLRRRGYHVLYKLLKSSNKPFLGILFIKNGAKKLPYKLFEKDIEDLLKKASVV